MSWDRSKQKFWILRRGIPWHVISETTKKKVCDFLPERQWDSDLIKAICFAQSEEEVKELLK